MLLHRCSTFSFVSLLCFVPGCLTECPMTVPWHYHLFSLLPPQTPPPQSSASSPPPQPVAYLYPGDSKEPIKALQTSSARHSSVHKSNHTMSLWSPATLPPLQRRQINTTKASTAGNYNCIGLQMTNRRWYSTLARTIWDFFDAGCTWIHSLEDQKYEKHCICLLTRFFKCLCDVDKDWKNPLHVWHEWR